LPEEFLNLLHPFHKPVHIGPGFEKIQTHAGMGFVAAEVTRLISIFDWRLRIADLTLAAGCIN